MRYIILILLGCIIGIVAAYFYFSSAIKQRVEIDTKIINENNIRQAELAAIQSALTTAENELSNIRTVLAGERVTATTLHSQVENENITLEKLRAEKDILNASLLDLHQQADNIKANIAESLDKDIEKIQQEYEQAKSEAQEAYIQTISDLSANVNEYLNGCHSDLDYLHAQINDAKHTMEAITAERIREENEQSLYMLELNLNDLHEIKSLKDVSKTFRDATPVNKLIWSLYYQKPYKTLCSLNFNDNKVCGIYSITDTITNKRYIGQSVDIATRWSEHIKRGLGAEKGPDTKLYTAMKEHGVENFKFEILEQVPREKLNEKERFWIAYFNSTIIGLNTTKGNT